MKKFLASVCGGAALVAFLAGCDPHLAQIENGSEEALWYKKMRENYPQFTPPRTPAPAVYTSPNWNNVSRQGGAAVPADDPEQTVDSAAEGKNVKALRDVEELPAGGKEKSGTGNTPAVPEPQVQPENQKADPAAPGNTGKKTDAAAAPEKQSAPEGKLYVVQAGDTLSGISQKFYGKASLEDVIFKANSKVLKNRNALSIGMRLVIPEL
ncbi:MAG: LysM peptidoglycan-binding domain-containing protein [Lentisphaeria bacterium]|nr:LysM peptidoglycan-binding domain-containing protein [Lentisphaeria bacterium]